MDENYIRGPELTRCECPCDSFIQPSSASYHARPYHCPDCSTRGSFFTSHPPGLRQVCITRDHMAQPTGFHIISGVERRLQAISATSSETCTPILREITSFIPSSLMYHTAFRLISRARSANPPRVKLFLAGVSTYPARRLHYPYYALSRLITSLFHMCDPTSGKTHCM